MLLKGNFLRQFENFEMYKGSFVKPIKRDWVVIRRPLQSLLLRYTTENLQVTLFQYAL